jgi:hypothetical protein
MSQFLNTAKPKPITFAMLIFSLVSASILTVMFIHSEGNYAFAQKDILRTTEIKVKFDVLVERGDDQNIRVKVNDVGTGDPVSGSIVQITIYFPGGAPIRQFSLLSDKDGEASLKLPIDDNAALGEYGMDLQTDAIGYFDSFLPSRVSFAVMSEVDNDISLKDYKHTSQTISKSKSK